MNEKLISTKLSRHAEIAQILTNNVVRSQAELREILKTVGFEVTQATLSRDLEELDATKRRDKDGNLYYSLSGSPEVADYPLSIPGTLENWVSQLLTGVSLVKNQVLLHTPPGAASTLAAALDKEIMDGVLGCIAGDNTVLIICDGDESASELSKRLSLMTQR